MSTDGLTIRDAETWHAVMGVRMPRITVRGDVESAAVTGLREDALTPDEAEALADALRDFAAHAREADRVVSPHLRAAVEAGRSLQS